MQFLESYLKNNTRNRNSWHITLRKYLTMRKTMKFRKINFLPFLRVFVIGVSTSSSVFILWKWLIKIITCVNLRLLMTLCRKKCDEPSSITKRPVIFWTVLHVDRTTRDLPNWKNSTTGNTWNFEKIFKRESKTILVKGRFDLRILSQKNEGGATSNISM